MNKYKREILGGFLMLALLAFAFAQSARLFIGDVTITDTLSGTARFNNDINVEGGGVNLEGASTILTMGTTASDIQLGYSTITKDLILSSNQSSGNKIILDFPSNAGGEYEFKLASVEKFSMNNGGLTLFLPTDSIRFADGDKTGSVSNVMGYIKVYVGGEARYIQLYDTP